MALFQTLQTWIGHNAMRYHNLNRFPQMLSYILSDIWLILGDLQRVTMRYIQSFFKNIITYIFLQI